jgi:hypothetical protein
VSDQIVVDTSGRDMTESRFAASFPSRFEAAMQTARGVVEGIEAASAEGEGRGELLYIESIRAYHEIYRLRIELELETAAVLRRAAESAWALLDVADAMAGKVEDGEAAALRESVAKRRAAIVMLAPPFAEGERGDQESASRNGSASNSNGKEPVPRF